MRLLILAVVLAFVGGCHIFDKDVREVRAPHHASGSFSSVRVNGAT
jgi:hypothetical protein